MIIGITGLHQDVEKNRQTIGAGKDAAAARLIEKHGFVRIGIADRLKRICKEVFEFTDEQLWGPSDMRNAPDKRYPRGTKGAEDWRKKADEAEREYSARHQMVVEEHASMRQLKEDATTFASFGWLTPRYALQQLGTQWGRDCFDSVWIEDALRTAKQLVEVDGWRYTEKKGLEFSVNYDKPHGVVFSDVRFNNEFKSIKKAGGKIVRVKRFSWKLFDKSVDTQHQSETEMLSYGDEEFDYIIDNGGDLHHLGLLVDRMMDTFKGKVIPYDESQQNIPPALRK